MYCTHVQYPNHLSAGNKNYTLSGHRNKMKIRIEYYVLYFDGLCFHLKFQCGFLGVLGVVNCLSCILKGRNK